MAKLWSSDIISFGDVEHIYSFLNRNVIGQFDIFYGHKHFTDSSQHFHLYHKVTLIRKQKCVMTGTKRENGTQLTGSDI